METRVLIQSESKPIETFPPPNDASDKISFQSAYWLQRYSCLKVLTDPSTSIKGRNSVANLRLTKIYKTNIDLVNDNVYSKFGLNVFILSQDIEQKTKSDINQGP